MRDIICITGMHRSGTSLTASWLELCGITIHDGNYYGPNTGNPKGHFEDKDFVDLHSSAIRLETPQSHGWKIDNNNFLSFGDKHLSEAIKFVKQRNEKYELWGWKDPRTVFYLMHWKKLIPSLKVVLIWRPCAIVSHSLIKRSKKAIQDVYNIKCTEPVKLWMSYNKRVCEYKRLYPHDTLLLHIETIIKKDQNVLSLINEVFKINLFFRPIDDVYDQNLLKAKSSSILTRILGFCNRSRNLERTLRALSDI